MDLDIESLSSLEDRGDNSRIGSASVRNPTHVLVARSQKPIRPKRKVLAAVHGHIRGVEIGQRWDKQLDCWNANVHGHQIAGIHGRSGKGAFSVVLSGGYDNVDKGDTFTYVGTGGYEGDQYDVSRHTNGKKRNADQSASHKHNSYLIESAKAFPKKPVRVIRGAKSKGCNKYAPSSGYRYDGLYTVESWREEINPSHGYKDLRFEFKAVPGECKWAMGAIHAQTGDAGVTHNASPGPSNSVGNNDDDISDDIKMKTERQEQQEFRGRKGRREDTTSSGFISDEDDMRERKFKRQRGFQTAIPSWARAPLYGVIKTESKDVQLE